MDLVKIQLKDLKTFCASELFRQFDVKPISPLRLESYIHNPRANGEDIVLYMWLADKKLIAFWLILPDYIETHTEKIRFGWCTGAWVNPNYRRQGLSTSLLHASYQDWQGRLMFTNYSKISEDMFDHTHQFPALAKRNGLRFYLYPDFNQLYKNRSGYGKIKWLLPVVSLGVSTVSRLKSLFYRKNKSITSVELDGLDAECRTWLENYPDTFFNRKSEELDWMMRYPWVTQSPQTLCAFPFSYIKSNVRLRILKVFENQRFAGFFIYTIIDAKMKIIYHFLEENDWHLMVSIVSEIARKYKIEYLTVLDTHLSRFFKQEKTCFAVTKSYNMHIYSSLGLANQPCKPIFDGDGDNGFT
jgi:GNAT superfamily N-acetyltransferase